MACIPLKHHAYISSSPILKSTVNDPTLAQALTRLDHPNIVRYIGYVSSPPTFGLVLEFCEQGDLSAALTRPTPPGFALHIARGLVSAIGYLHAGGIMRKQDRRHHPAPWSRALGPRPCWPQPTTVDACSPQAQPPGAAPLSATATAGIPNALRLGRSHALYMRSSTCTVHALLIHMYCTLFPLADRDIKSPNVLMACDAPSALDDRDGLPRLPTPKLTDFGVATELPESGVDSTAETGTYRWMAPEVVKHEHYSSNADIYSCTAVRT